jgi:excisionase family DNA binding protein
MSRPRPTRRSPVDRVVQSNVAQRLLLTSAEACAALGMTRDQLYHLRKKGRIPFIQVSERRYYYSLDELHAWMRGEWQPREVVR